MDKIFDWARNSEKIVFLGCVVSLAVSALSSVVAHSAEDVLANFYRFLRVIPAGSAFPKKRVPHDSAYKPPAPSQVAKERAVARIEEAKRALRNEVSSAKWSRISSNSLTVGQYIIGGLLASSFVQEALSRKLVGSLGLLVLLASLIKQHFHPELSAEQATKKAAQLKSLVRVSEDQLAILDARIASGQDHTDAMVSLLMRITERLTEIETPEVVEQRPGLSEKSD